MSRHSQQALIAATPGRPLGDKVISERIMAKLYEIDHGAKGKPLYLDRLVTELFKMALGGDLKCMQEIFNRAEGSTLRIPLPSGAGGAGGDGSEGGVELTEITLAVRRSEGTTEEIKTATIRKTVAVS